MSKESAPLSRFKSEVCMVCDAHNSDLSSNPQNMMSADHIIPQTACKRYSALVPIKNQPDNLVTVCRKPCHNMIDNTKLKTYWQYGLKGILTFVGIYPRSVNFENCTKQQKQWINLYEDVYDNLDEYITGKSPFIVRDRELLEYHESIAIVEGYLNKWNQDRFEVTKSDVAQFEKVCYNIPIKHLIPGFPEYIGYQRGRRKELATTQAG